MNVQRRDNEPLWKLFRQNSNCEVFGHQAKELVRPIRVVCKAL